MVDGSEGADPSAEDPPEEKSDDQGEEPQEEEKRYLVGGEQRGQSDEGIELQEYPHWIADFVDSPVACQDQEYQKEDEEEELANQAEFSKHE